jgi:2-succinyl-6-hydroxy-2,4-cyclohexadiene-1-carboxylate synthase
VRSRSGDEPVQLVAYSMGGRLALHALLRVPGLFPRALILSSRPWLEAADVVPREAWDQAWAARFARDAWPDLERDWDAQSVFTGSGAGARRRDDDLRPALADSLRNWSPRHHAFTAADLRHISARVDWAFGASDQKYLGVAKQLQELPVGGQISIIPNAGHRLPHDAPDFITRWVNEEKP